MKRSLVVVGAIAASLSATGLHAQGSSVFVQSACMSGRNGAGVATPCADGSGIFYNPAGIATHPSVVSIGATGVYTSGAFRYDYGAAPEVEREGATVPVPHAYATFRLGNILTAGIGAFAPYGLTIDWGEPEAFEGRFSSYRTQNRNIYIQPTLAAEVIPGRLFVGAGADIVFSSLELNQRADLADVPLGIPGSSATFGNLGIVRGTDFAEARLEGDGTGVTGHVGVIARLGDALSIGGRYLHSTKIELEGDAVFTPIATGIVLPPNNPLNARLGLPANVPLPLDNVVAPQFAEGGQLVTQSIASVEDGELELPSQWVVGASLRALPNLNISADYHRINWSSFDQLVIDFGAREENQTLVFDYHDASSYRFGAELGASQGLVLRGGFTHSESATPIATPLLPENERDTYAVGLGYQLTPGLGIDLMYQYNNQPDRRGRLRAPTDPALMSDYTAQEVGVYSGTIHSFGATVSYRFGSRSR